MIYRARIDAWFEQILDHRKCPGLSKQEELAHKLVFNDDNVPSYPWVLENIRLLREVQTVGLEQ